MNPILKNFEFPFQILSHQKLEGYGSINYLLNIENDKKVLLKIYPKTEKITVLEEERIIETLARNFSYKLPLPLYSHSEQGDYFLRYAEFLEGSPLYSLEKPLLKTIAHATAEFLHAFKKIDSPVFKSKEHNWNLRDAFLNIPKLNFIAPEERKFPKYFFDWYQMTGFWEMKYLPQSLIHGDLNEANIIVKNHVFTGFIDFGDMSHGPAVAEVAILLTYLMMLAPKSEYIKIAVFVLSEIHRTYTFTEAEIQILPALIGLRLSVSVVNSAGENSFT